MPGLIGISIHRVDRLARNEVWLELLNGHAVPLVLSTQADSLAANRQEALCFASDFCFQPRKERGHKVVAFLADAPSGLCGEPVFDLGELDDELVDRGVLAATVLVVSFGNLGPQALACCAAEGEHASHADGADSVELVGIEQALGFEGLRGRPGAKAVTADGLRHGLNFFRRLTGQNFVCALGGDLFVSHAPVIQSDVVQQRRRADDLHIGAFGLGKVDSQRGDAQHVIKIVRSVASGIERAGLLGADQRGISWQPTNSQTMSATRSAA